MASKKIKAIEQIPEVISEQEKSKDNVLPFKKPKSAKEPSLVPELVITIAEAKKRVSVLKKFVDELMVPGVDYGIVSGIDKPSLLKPGAEKLCDAFGFCKKVEIINRVEDWHHGGIFHYEVRVSLLNRKTNTIECEGVGCCNSRESRYINQRGYDVANVILKIAKKRAFVDSILTVIRGSDLFTQDLEDTDWLWNKSQVKGEQKKTDGNSPASMKQLSQIFSVVAVKKIPLEKVKAVMLEKYKVTESKKLNSLQSDEFLKYLRGLKESDYKEVKHEELPSINTHEDA